MREELGTGIGFVSLRDKKFKHNRMTVRLIMPLRRETASNNAAVPFLLRRGCRRLPDFTKLNQELCRLYGATLSCDVSKINANQVLELTAVSIDEGYALDGTPLTERCAKLLLEVLFEPALDEKGLFRKEDLQVEKQQLLDAIESLMNEKRSYALLRGKQHLCGDHPLAIHKYGDYDSMERISQRSVTAAYQRILQTAQVEISFVGCGDGTAAKEIFREGFAYRTTEPEKLLREHLEPTGVPPRNFEEEMDVTQGKLVLGFRTTPCDTPEQTAAFRIMSAVYGGTPNSLLFTNVREKLSLCYYCVSRYDKLSGLLLADSGVEFENRDKAQTEMLRQLDLMREGKFSDEDLANAIRYAQNTLNGISDSLGAIDGWYFSQAFQKSRRSPADDAKLLESVTKAQVLWAARNTFLDTAYFLKGKEEA